MEMKLQFKNLSERGARRLLVLADKLDSLTKRDREHFCMDFFFTHEGDDDHKGMQDGKLITPKILGTCGTVACAMGWAGALPAFQKQGLKHVMEVARSQEGEDKGKIQSLESSFELNGHPMSPFEAAEEFFGLNAQQAAYLFGGNGAGLFNGESDPKLWASQCRYFVQTDGDGRLGVGYR